MNDTTLFLIALGASGVGLGLLVLSLQLSPELKDLLRTGRGGITRIKATIEEVRVAGDRTTMRLAQTCRIDAVVFDAINLTNVSRGSCVLVSGRRGEYRGDPQLVVDKILLC